MTPLVVGWVFFNFENTFFFCNLPFAELEKFCPSLKKKEKKKKVNQRQNLELFHLESVKQVEK